MADFDKNPDNMEPLTCIDGVYYRDTDVLKAIAKALIAKGVLTKADITAQL